MMSTVWRVTERASSWKDIGTISHGSHKQKSRIGRENMRLSLSGLQYPGDTADDKE